MHTENEEVLLKLAKELAINHFNVSLLEEGEYAFKKIFNSDIKYHGMSRNILIVGAGASNSSHEIFKVSSEIIYDLYSKFLNLNEAFSASTSLYIKFLADASRISNHHYVAHRFSISTTLKNIFSKLSFEDSLKLISLYTSNDDLAEKLKTGIINSEIDSKGLAATDRIPCLVYEVIAHLFKHRYIDVVINMNFDQMLDNAIEDEMGSSTYYKIVHDSDIIRLREIVDEKRLRIPIYIKPHGTYRSSSSMKYTLERYFSQPEAMNLLLKDICSGSLQNPEESSIEYINYIFAGYAFRDVDIQSVVFEQIVAKWKRDKTTDHINFRKLNFFIFDRDPKQYKENFVNAFLQWFDKEHNESFRYRDSILKTLEEDCLNLIQSGSYPSTTIDKVSMGYQFERLYEQVRSQFKQREPFVPRELTRHILLTKIFNRQFVSDGFSNDEDLGLLKKEPRILYRKLSIFHCIYTFIKFKGRIPINEITSHRTGKYNMLYFNEVQKNNLDGNKQVYGSSLIDSLKGILSTLNVTIVVNHTHVYCEEFYNAKFGDENYNKIINCLIERGLFWLVNRDISASNKELIRGMFAKDIVSKDSMIINANYTDSKHARFQPFKHSNVINTNLELTWKFYNFCKSDTWKTLCMIDDSGRPIYNLHRYSDLSMDCYLKKMKGNKNVFLLHSIENPICHVDNLKSELSIFEVIREQLGDNFHSELVGEEKIMHKMALFLDENNSPIYGIYFFKPDTKTRINPVLFNNETKSNKANLKIMLDIFKESAPKSLIAKLWQ